MWHRIMRCDPCRENNFRISSQGLQSANIRTPVCSSKRPSSASPNLWIFWPRSQRRMTEPATNSKRIEVQCTYNGETKRITNSVVPHQLSSTVLSPINEVPNGTAAQESKSVTLVTKQSNFSSGIEDDGIEDGYSDSDVILL